MKNKDITKMPEWENKKVDITKMEKKFRTVLVGTLLVIVALALLGYYLMSRYTTTLLKVYATQQDNYVQLVLDQINLQQDGTEESIISNIIDTLDSGKTHYWTLAREDSLIYVKNVLETEQYRGSELDQFYDTQSAESFIDNLRLNRVTHDIFAMNGVTYVASGVLFEYNGMQYGLCLITDETVILDNNEFLATRIAMYIFAGVLLVLLLISVMVAETLLKSKELDLNLMRGRLELQNLRIERLETEAKQRNAYDTRLNVYHSSLLQSFVTKLKAGGMKTGTLVRLEFADDQERTAFLNEALVKLDETIVRFRQEDGAIILLFSGYDGKEAQTILERMKCRQYIQEVQSIEEQGV